MTEQQFSQKFEEFALSWEFKRSALDLEEFEILMTRKITELREELGMSNADLIRWVKQKKQQKYVPSSMLNRRQQQEIELMACLHLMGGGTFL
jgi:hypothetical protein